MAFDVGSYVVSGKTMTDHGLSLVAQQDCKMSRIVDGDVCRSPLDVEEAGATLRPMDDHQVAALLTHAVPPQIQLAGAPEETNGAQMDDFASDPFVMGFVATSPTAALPAQFDGHDRVSLRAGAARDAGLDEGDAGDGLSDPLATNFYLAASPEA